MACEIELASVDYHEQSIATQGGLRLSYAPHSDETALPEVHAGDEIAVVAQTRLPQVFRDDGAFDRRAYLRSQGIDLTASLRSPKLLERVASSKPTMFTRLAGLRRLRENLVSLFPGSPDEAAVLRAMLLGDRAFLDRSEW